MKTWKPLIIAIAVLLLTLTACVSEYLDYRKSHAIYEREKAEDAAYARERQLAFSLKQNLPKDSAADLKISASDLLDAWYNDPTRAKLLYQDKKLQVTGFQNVAVRFSETQNGYRVILGGSGNYYSVIVDFPKTAAEQLLYMTTTNGVMLVTSRNEGVVTIVGTFKNYSSANRIVTIDDAYFVMGIQR